MTARVSDLDAETDVDEDLAKNTDENAAKNADENLDRDTDENADENLDQDTDEDTDEDGSVSDEPARRDRRWLDGRRLVVALLVVAAVVAGLGGWFLVRAGDLRETSTSNSALLDAGRTAEVSAAVTTALNRIFSYAYDRTEDTEAAADGVLRGSARDAYEELFKEVRAQAPAQKLVLTSRVVTAAVQELSADRAKVLVFLDQSATRADSGASNASAAQLSVTMALEGETWVITGLEPR